MKSISIIMKFASFKSFMKKIHFSNLKSQVQWIFDDFSRDEFAKIVFSHANRRRKMIISNDEKNENDRKFQSSFNNKNKKQMNIVKVFLYSHIWHLFKNLSQRNTRISILISISISISISFRSSIRTSFSMHITFRYSISTMMQFSETFKKRKILFTTTFEIRKKTLSKSNQRKYEKIFKRRKCVLRKSFVKWDCD